MTDQEISSARDALNELFRRAEGVCLLPPDDPSMSIYDAIDDARDALQPLGNPKATALLDELERLMPRIPGKVGRTRTLDGIHEIRGAVSGAIIALINYVNATVGAIAFDKQRWRGTFGELFGASPGDDMDVVIEKVTQYLSSLCQ